MAKPLLDILCELFEYDSDFCMPHRNNEDQGVKALAFGRRKQIIVF
jgi:hypothetical protein